MPVKKKNSGSHVIWVMEKESPFRKLLVSIIRRETDRFAGLLFNVHIISNPKELKTYTGTSADLAFIDLGLIGKHLSVFAKMKCFKKSTILVLLISDESGSIIKRAIEVFKSQSHYFFDEHILKDNYNSNVLSVFCRELIQKMIDKKRKNNKKR